MPNRASPKKQFGVSSSVPKTVMISLDAYNELKNGLEKKKCLSTNFEAPEVLWKESCKTLKQERNDALVKNECTISDISALISLTTPSTSASKYSMFLQNTKHRRFQKACKVSKMGMADFSVTPSLAICLNSFYD